jgi:hypothetical protein
MLTFASCFYAGFDVSIDAKVTIIFVEKVAKTQPHFLTASARLHGRLA